MKILFFLLMFVLLTSCTAAEKNPDAAADEKLGLIQEEEVGEAQEALKDLKEIRRRHEEAQLERQITDPLVNTAEN